MNRELEKYNNEVDRRHFSRMLAIGLFTLGMMFFILEKL